MNNEGCLICDGNSDGFTVCVQCGVAVYLERGTSTTNDMMEYLKKHNRERFDVLIKQYGNEQES